MNETLCTIALGRLRGVGLRTALDCYRHYGTASAVFEHRKDLRHRLPAIAADWSEALRSAEAELEFCNRHGIRVLCLSDDAYPMRLRDCADAPTALYYRGAADLNVRRVVAVVGTRHITDYGKDVCARFVADLRAMFPDCLVVSGLAYGVDIHAHRAALDGGLSTVAVLAHGLDTIYPASHRRTAEAMLRQGGLLTEYASQTRPDKGNFVRRNRIVAGMADATVVVESAEKGGALITARLAQDYNRDVFAFPGRVGDACSAGCNALIRQNVAALVTSAADVADALGWKPAGTTAAVQREIFPELSPDEAGLCELLRGSDGVAVSRLAVRTGLPVQRISALLFELELKGVVRPLAGGRFRLIG